MRPATLVLLGPDRASIGHEEYARRAMRFSAERSALDQAHLDEENEMWARHAAERARLHLRVRMAERHEGGTDAAADREKDARRISLRQQQEEQALTERQLRERRDVAERQGPALEGLLPWRSVSADSRLVAAIRDDLAAIRAWGGLGLVPHLKPVARRSDRPGLGRQLAAGVGGSRASGLS